MILQEMYGSLLQQETTGNNGKIYYMSDERGGSYRGDGDVGPAGVSEGELVTNEGINSTFRVALYCCD